MLSEQKKKISSLQDNKQLKLFKYSFCWNSMWYFGKASTIDQFSFSYLQYHKMYMISSSQFVPGFWVPVVDTHINHWIWLSIVWLKRIWSISRAGIYAKKPTPDSVSSSCSFVVILRNQIKKQNNHSQSTVGIQRSSRWAVWDRSELSSLT